NRRCMMNCRMKLITALILLILLISPIAAADKDYQILRLDSICDGYWRVRNYNQYDVAFTWSMDGTGYSGSGVAQDNGDVFFNTPACSETGSPQTVRVSANDFENVYEPGSCQPCPTTTTTTTTTIVTTLFFDYQILRLDNMADGYWRVRNYNPYDVAFTWVMDGTGQAGYGNVHATSDAYFNTSTCSETGSPQTVRIFAIGFENYHESAICENYTVTITTTAPTATTTSVPIETTTPSPGDLSIYVEDNTIYIGQTVNINVNAKGEIVTNAAIYLNDVLIDFTDDSGQLEFIMPEIDEGLVSLKAIKGTSSDTVLVLVIGGMIDGQTTSTTSETYVTTTSPGFAIPVVLVVIFILTARLYRARKRRRFT
ncbi:MAG: hypothetical protein KAJ19_18675, partial [Gammaproteobacteria bacterium]|nr:hypothetical protein [Gammaproteobacteria bacterium]